MKSSRIFRIYCVLIVSSFILQPHTVAADICKKENDAFDRNYQFVEKKPTSKVFNRWEARRLRLAREDQNNRIIAYYECIRDTQIKQLNGEDDDITLISEEYYKNVSGAQADLLMKYNAAQESLEQAYKTSQENEDNTDRANSSEADIP
jgi:hypothetical protein